MRFFVTGATGFIGTELCQRLVSLGHEVSALVRNPEKATKLPPQVTQISGDLSFFASPTTVLEPHDIVVHLAGVVTADSEADYEKYNYTAVRDLLAFLERQSWKPRRLLFASSLAAAGPSPSNRPWTEEDRPAPIEAYGRAKAAAEELLQSASFPVTSFRPCIVLGPDDPASLTLFKSARYGIGFRVGGSPQKLSFVDVRDVVSSILAMAEDDRNGNYTYFVSHHDATDISKIWQAMEVAFGKPVRVVSIPKRLLKSAVPVTEKIAKLLGRRNQLDAKQYTQLTAPAFVCSSEALQNDLKWRAEHGLQDCIDNALRGYRESGMLS